MDEYRASWERLPEGPKPERAAEYTPSDKAVRSMYEEGRIATAGAYDEGEVDRWLAEHDRQVAARAWDEGVKSECDYHWRCEESDAAGQGVVIFRPKNPHRMIEESN